MYEKPPYTDKLRARIFACLSWNVREYSGRNLGYRTGDCIVFALREPHGGRLLYKP